MTCSIHPLHIRIYVRRLQQGPVVTGSNSIISELTLRAPLTRPIPTAGNRTQPAAGVPKRLRSCYCPTQLLVQATTQTIQMSSDAHFGGFLEEQAQSPDLLMPASQH